MICNDLEERNVYETFHRIHVYNTTQEGFSIEYQLPVRRLGGLHNEQVWTCLGGALYSEVQIEKV